MKYPFHFLLLFVFCFALVSCQTFSDKEPELQQAPPDSNLAKVGAATEGSAKDGQAPYTVVYEPPKPLAADHPARIDRGQQLAMVTPSKPGIPKPEKLPSGKYRLRSVLVVGDSFAVGIGMSLSSLLKPYDDISLFEKGKTSSGLNSTKFYNWQEKLREDLDANHPDVLVVMISGNDAHNGSGSDSWARSYEEKMGGFLGIAAAYGVPIYLVGLPPMGKEDYSERAKVANQAIKRACEKTSDCEFVDAWPLFSDEAGAFTRHKTIDGASQTLRGKDGVHFTMTGYKLLGNEILDHVDKRFELIKPQSQPRQSQAKKQPARQKTASAK